uniref:Dolichyl-diphosphooligosaccharide--protein glycosyltransferase subunit DAD1 n=1 Tax=Dromaius novaehollandiae TaxID=8790 RepID=A0A8C4K4U4_DRONO
MSGAAGSGSGSSTGAAGLVGSVVQRFLVEYGSGTPSRLKVLDAYLLHALLAGVLQFTYCLGVGTFPSTPFSAVSSLPSAASSSACASGSRSTPRTKASSRAFHRSGHLLISSSPTPSCILSLSILLAEL